jgi:cytochrome P450
VQGEGKFVNVAHPWTWKQLLGGHSLSVAVGEDHARKRAVLSKAFTPTYVSGPICLCRSTLHGLYAHAVHARTHTTHTSEQ